MASRILIADDDYFCAHSLARYLRKNGHEAIVVRDGLEVMNAFSLEEFDLCMFDFHLPGKPVSQVILELRERGIETPFIFMTGDANPETEKTARKLGPVFYFIKPFNLSDLKSVIESALSHVKPHGHVIYKVPQKSQSLNETETFGEWE